MRSLEAFLLNPFVGLAMAFILIVIGWKLNTAGANWLLIVSWGLVAVSVFRTPPIAQQVFIQRGLWTLLIASCVGLGLCWLSGWQPPKEPVTSVLSISARAPNITYPKGKKIGGIEWQEGYGELQVTVQNTAEATIQNLDLTVQVLDEGTILNMGQLSDISGIEFRPPDDAPDLGVTLIGKDGSVGTVTTRDIQNRAGVKFPIFSNHWKVFLPRLIGMAKLRLVLATETRKIVGVIPTKVKVFGSYELMPGEGSKTVRVDTTVPINR
jgi:hypothetical protein